MKIKNPSFRKYRKEINKAPPKLRKELYKEFQKQEKKEMNAEAKKRLFGYSKFYKKPTRKTKKLKSVKSSPLVNKIKNLRFNEGYHF